MILNIANYVSGTVTIQIFGEMPEKFINLCLAQHIFLWEIKKIDNEFYARLTLVDFFRIRSIARKSQCRVRVVAHRGLPFLLKRVKRRKMMVAGALLCLVALQIIASYVWFVDVTGIKTLNADTVKKVAYQNGLKPGTLKNDISQKTIEHEIILNIPEIAWASVRFTGTRAVIEVVEKTMPRQEDKGPANIVAAKDGVITEFIALAGQPVVKKGDTVRKGEMLIKGVISAQSASGEPVPSQTPVAPQLVRAKGIVKARVWYEGYGEAEILKNSYQRTGKRDVAVIIRVGLTEVALKKADHLPYTLYETEVIDKKLPFWRNSGPIVESTISIYHELEACQTETTIEEARDEARGKALDSVQRMIPETAHVLARNQEVLKTAEPNLVRVKVNVETIEDIGRMVNISEQ